MYHLSVSETGHYSAVNNSRSWIFSETRCYHIWTVQTDVKITSEYTVAIRQENTPRQLTTLNLSDELVHRKYTLIIK